VLTSACTSTRIAFGEKHPGGVGDGTKAGAGHLEHTELAHRAEAVLDGADDTMRVMTLALEVEDGVHDVLERLRSGEVAVLGHVADEDGRDVLTLGGKQELRRRLAHLPHAAGRRLELDREDGLNGVDDDECRLEPRDLLQDPLDARFGQQIERRGANAEPVAAALDLVLGLLA